MMMGDIRRQPVIMNFREQSIRLLGQPAIVGLFGSIGNIRWYRVRRRVAHAASSLHEREPANAITHGIDRYAAQRGETRIKASGIATVPTSARKRCPPAVCSSKILFVLYVDRFLVRHRASRGTIRCSPPAGDGEQSSQTSRRKRSYFLTASVRSRRSVHFTPSLLHVESVRILTASGAVSLQASLLRISVRQWVLVALRRR